METQNGDWMKRVVVDQFGGLEVLRVIDGQIPRPGPGEVRVKVLAAGVSYPDAMLRAGSYLGVPSRRSRPAMNRLESSKSSDRDVRGCKSETVSAR